MEPRRETVGRRTADRRGVLNATAGVAFGLLSVGTGGRRAVASGDGGGSERWRFQTEGNLWGGVTAVDGTVYAGTGEGTLYAVDAATGEAEWRFGAETNRRTAPTVADGTVFVGRHKYVCALDAATGVVLWTFDRTDSSDYSAPALAGGTLYVGDANSTVHALDPGTGEASWQYETSEQHVDDPTVADGTVYVSAGDLHALDAETGDPRWTFRPDGEVFPAPTVDGDTVFVGGSDGRLYAIEVGSGRARWTFDPEGTGAGPTATVPTVASGTVFVGNDDGYLYAVDSATGEEQWRFDVGDTVLSSPTVAQAADGPEEGSEDGTVVVGSPGGTVHALASSTGEERWQFEIGSTVASSPTVVDGTVYVGAADGILYAIDAGEAGSSDGSRVQLGTLGHHGESVPAQQTVDRSEDARDRVARYRNRSTSSGPTGGTPGMGIPASLAGLGVVSYLLGRRRSDDGRA